MTDRHADLPATPAPSMRAISASILSASGSAPGCDNTPYDIFNFGTNFTAHLLGQAMHAAQKGEWILARVLGTNTDVLLWIPKKEGAAKI
eukprot:5700624-Heterocapsa_arctica.AAC.1